MTKTIVFDMDGTLADFYGVDGWLDDLNAENTHPYEAAEPLFSMLALKRQIRKMKKDGWMFKIVTWGSKQSSEDFLDRTKAAKLEWLKRYHLINEMESIMVVPYGTPKHELASGILFDDNDTICADWARAGGQVVNVNQFDLLSVLKSLK